MSEVREQSKRNLVITISGPHGTGKSTYARALARALGLRYVSAGIIFRDLAKQQSMTLEAFSKYAAENSQVDKMIDDRTKDEAKKGNVVIDAQLGAWILQNEADVKILLVAPDEIRFKRIAGRDHVSFETAKRETLAREEIQRSRYMKYYSINVTDQTIYDLKVDTSTKSINQTEAFILQAVKGALSNSQKNPE